jgi:asparagine synthase (glutamine-hydrolysing)
VPLRLTAGRAELMCGIAGFWNYRTRRPASPGVIRAMTESIRHRGPDGDGFFEEGALALGSRRLIVTDPEGGAQPMSNEDGTVHVVFNGAIYNHVALRGELESLGHRFRTRCDTEAIVHAWEAWGTRCVERFNGMFAFAVWDSVRRQLFIARDRLGIKPLYVWQGAEGMVFGSELKAVLRAPWVPCVWDREAIDDFMTYEYVPAPRSIVADVKKLPQGSWLLFDEARPDAPVEPRRFWMLNASTANGSASESEEAIRDGLATSVRRRLMADVPLGAFLSGGIDSSIIVGLMSRELGARTRTFSLGFEDSSYDEREYARAVAAQYGTAHREDTVTMDVLGLAERLAHAYDEPFGDVSAFPTYMISAMARQDVTVALSGDGGDELFAGYDSYRADRWANRISWMTDRWGWRAVDSLLAGVPPRPAKKGAVNKLKRFVEGIRHPRDLEHARWLVFWDTSERRSLYTPHAQEAVAGRDCYAHYRGLLREGTEQGFSGLNRQLYADIRGYLADDILAKVDRASMAVSLEVRVPFLDHEMVETAMRIPAEQKLRNGESKWILRKAFASLLPPVVRNRGKEGFSMPMKQWLAGALEPLMRDTLSRERLAARGLFDAAEVERLMAEHVSGRHNHAHRLWCLMALELSLTSLEAAVRARPERGSQ